MTEVEFTIRADIEITDDEAMEIIRNAFEGKKATIETNESRAIGNIEAVKEI